MLGLGDIFDLFVVLDFEKKKSVLILKILQAICFCTYYFGLYIYIYILFFFLYFSTFYEQLNSVALCVKLWKIDI